MAGLAKLKGLRGTKLVGSRQAGRARFERCLDAPREVQELAFDGFIKQRGDLAADSRLNCYTLPI